MMEHGVIRGGLPVIPTLHCSSTPILPFHAHHLPEGVNDLD